MEDWDATQLSPSISIDRMWHAHILDTRSYIEFCTSFAGRIIHHDPNGGLDHAARQQRIQSTKFALRARYGGDFDSEVWNFDSDTVRNVGSVPKEEPGPKRKKARVASRGSRNITITVRNLSGKYRRSFSIPENRPIRSLFEAFSAQSGIPMGEFQFIHGQHQLAWDDIPVSLGLEDGDQIYVTIRLRSC